jgi:hypothetical protein
MAGLTFAFLSFSMGHSAPGTERDSTGSAVETSVTESASDSLASHADGDTVVAYYFHGTQRCVTCRKLESYSAEALNSGFQSAIADSSLVWRPIDFDLKDNEHFIKDYQLFTKAVILSRVRSGTEIAWKNLDQIWLLVDDKEAFLAYVKSETEQFLKNEITDE